MILEVCILTSEPVQDLEQLTGLAEFLSVHESSLTEWVVGDYSYKSFVSESDVLAKAL